MKTPKLNEIDLNEAMTGFLEGGGLFATMSTGQWDALLDEVYQRGGTLIELNEHEMPVRAYRRLPQ